MTGQVHLELYIAQTGACWNSELLIRKSAVTAARDDGLDERVLVSPVEERIEAV